MTLLAAYNFDEASGDVLDVTGNGHDFPLGALGVRTASGHTNGGLTRNTDPGLITVADPAFGQTSLRTVMCWVKGAGTTWLARWTADALGGSGAWGLLHIGGNIAVQARDAAGSLITRPTYPHPGDGAWHHYAAVYDGTAVLLYVDGVLRASTPHTGGLYATANRIDVMEPTDTGTTMDDLRVLDEAPDPAAIATLRDTPVGAAPALSGAVTLSASVALAASGKRTAAGTAQLGATAGLAVAGARTAAGTVALPAAAGLAATGRRSTSAAAPLTATAGLSVAGASARAGTVVLRASAALEVAPASQARDITLTATLAPQTRHTAGLAGQTRWTASLGAQP